MNNFIILNYMNKEYENKLYKNGFKYIAGLDEVGRGCLAGPLVVALVIFDHHYVNNEINDSKKISKTKRHYLFKEIINNAIYWDYIIYDADFVDKYNPKRTSILGMEYLVNNSKHKIDFVLVDAEKIDVNIESISIIKGDQKSQTIAAASIIAKTIRDLEIDKINKHFPLFEFNKHQGYGTKKHIEILKKKGPIKGIHRFSYKPIKRLLNK